MEAAKETCIEHENLGKSAEKCKINVHILVYMDFFL